jgi:hypothetical protein
MRLDGIKGRVLELKFKGMTTNKMLQPGTGRQQNKESWQEAEKG